MPCSHVVYIYNTVLLVCTIKYTVVPFSLSMYVYIHMNTHIDQHAGADTIALVPTRGAVDDDPVHSAYTIAPEW